MPHMADEKSNLTGVVGGDDYARGLVEPVTGLEQRPCCMCKSFEKNDARLRQHIASKKFMAIDADGTFYSVIDKDMPGRKGLKYNIRDFGWCRMQTIITDQLQTCELWSPTRSVSDLLRKIQR